MTRILKRTTKIYRHRSSWKVSDRQNSGFSKKFYRVLEDMSELKDTSLVLISLAQ